MNNRKKLKGFSLVELVLAIAIFSMIASFLVYLVIDSTRTFENIERRAEATRITKEIYSALKYLKSEEWFTIRKETDEGAQHIEFVDGKYTIVEGEITNSSITHSFNITLARRDESGMIVDEGGNIDPHTRVVNISISWVDRLGKEHIVNPKLYLNDWNINSIILTTKDDFNRGTHSDTTAAEATGGELRLQSVLYPDWCRPERMINQYDIPGDASARSIFAKPGNSYLGTRGGDVGDPFTKLKITGVAPPTLIVEGTFQGYKVNDIFVDGNYAYLATTDDSKEVVILDLTTTPYTEVGYVNASGDADANSVYVVGNRGYVAQGTYLRTFDLTQKTGSRSVLGSVEVVSWLFRYLGGTVSQVVVRDVTVNGVTKRYAYTSLNWDWYEFAIVEVTNASSPKIISTTTVNEQQVYDIEVSEDGNTVFFGTNSSSQKEFYIIDATNKSKPSILSSTDTNGMTVRGIAVVESGNVAILVGTGGEEYQVFSISNPSVPVKCGGMQIDTGIYDVASIIDSGGNTFSYIVTGDTHNEFKIIRGGPGGGEEETGYGFLESGTYISEVIDSKSDTSEYYTLSVDADIPTETTMKLQFKVAETTSALATTPWRGVDSETPYITESGVYLLPMGVSGRYLQYKVDFTSDITKAKSPLLKELIFEYEK